MTKQITNNTRGIMTGFDSHTDKRPSDSWFKSWFKMLSAQLEQRNDALVSLCIEIEGTPTFVPLNHYQFGVTFDTSYGCTRGCNFTAWGENYVYFPVAYDGKESVGSVPRNPELCATEHFGFDA